MLHSVKNCYSFKELARNIVRDNLTADIRKFNNIIVPILKVKDTNRLMYDSLRLVLEENDITYIEEYNTNMKCVLFTDSYIESLKFYQLFRDEIDKILDKKNDIMLNEVINILKLYEKENIKSKHL